MHKSHASIVTEHGSRYLQQLCKHWAPKFSVEFTPETGRIDASEDRSVFMSATPAALSVEVAAPDAEALIKWQEIVAVHLQRFGFREELTFDWQEPT